MTVTPFISTFNGKLIGLSAESLDMVCLFHQIFQSGSKPEFESNNKFSIEQTYHVYAGKTHYSLLKFKNAGIR